jgi:hypothetical protein
MATPRPLAMTPMPRPLAHLRRAWMRHQAVEMLGAHSARRACGQRQLTTRDPQGVIQELLSQKSTKKTGAVESSLTRQRKARASLLFSIRLSHRSADRSIAAKLYCPLKKSEYVPQVRKRIAHWECKLLITVNGRSKTLIHYGCDWLGAFLNAVEYLQKQIPFGQEDKWVDSSGVESWAVIPMRVPFSWGLDLYRKIAGYSVKEEQRFIARIEKRRLKHKNQMKRKARVA